MKFNELTKAIQYCDVRLYLQFESIECRFKEVYRSEEFPSWDGFPTKIVNRYGDYEVICFEPCRENGTIWLDVYLEGNEDED